MTSATSEASGGSSGGRSRSRPVAVSLILLLVFSSSALVVQMASASHDVPCTQLLGANPPAGSVTKAQQVASAVQTVTGNTAVGKVCNPNLYNGGTWSTQSQINTHVQNVMNKCGTGATNENIVQATIEVTGYPPGEGTGSCAKALFLQNMQELYGNSHTIDWNIYKGDTTNVSSAYTAVYTTLFRCSDPMVTQAVMQATSTLPLRGSLTQPTVGGNAALISQGQCNRSLYNHGEWYSLNDLVDRVYERSSSTLNCPNSAITDAYVALTGWKPLASAHPTGSGSECFEGRYANGPASWTSTADLRNLIYHSWVCREYHIGQVFYRDSNRRAYGNANEGECNSTQYGSVDVTGFLSYGGFDNLRQRVNNTWAALDGKGVRYRPGGDIETLNGQMVFDSEDVLIVSVNGVIASGGGNVIASGGGNIISNDAATFVATNGGTIAWQNASPVIASGGGNVIASGGGNVIASGGGN